MTKSEKEVQQRRSDLNRLQEKRNNNVELTDDEKKELNGLRAFFRNQTKVKDANGKEITINQRNSRAMVKDANGQEMTRSQRNSRAMVEDANGKEMTRSQRNNRAIVEDTNGKEMSRSQRNSCAIVEDANGKEMPRYQRDSHAIVEDANGKEMPRYQRKSRAKVKKRLQRLYKRALEVLESSEHETKDAMTKRVRDLVERMIGEFLVRPDVASALESGDYVFHIAAMQDHRDNEEWYINFFRYAAFLADEQPWSTQKNRMLKKSMKKDPLLLKIPVGNTPFQGDLGEEGAIDFIYNVKKLRISNDTVSASHGKSKGHAVPMYQYPGGECYGYRTERQEDKMKRYERASEQAIEEHWPETNPPPPARPSPTNSLLSLGSACS